MQLSFKSDRGGIEIQQVKRLSDPLCAFKSDRGGIEIHLLSHILIVGISSNQTVAGLKYQYPHLRDRAPHRSNQTVAGLKWEVGGSMYAPADCSNQTVAGLKWHNRRT